MTSELDALDTVPEQIKLSSGTFVQIEDLRARQFFKFLRIITHGALPVMRDFSIFSGADMTTEEFASRLFSVVAMSIPDAEDETIDFIHSMCKPVGLIEGRRNLNKADTERNAELWATLDAELENPELDDLITIIEAIVKRESEDIQALGKRLAAMFKLAQKTGQVPASAPSQTSPTSNFSVGSAEATTLSHPNTGGMTTSSAASPSSDSDSASQPSENVASTHSGSESNG